jgi:hypothetical protein
MRCVFKYEVPVEDHVTLELPCVHELLHFDNQKGDAVLWALVDPESAKIERHFRVAGTGHVIEETNIRFIGTAQFHGGSLVLHLFEVLS